MLPPSNFTKFCHFFSLCIFIFFLCTFSDPDRFYSQNAEAKAKLLFNKPVNCHFVKIKCHIDASGVEAQLRGHFLDAPFAIFERDLARFATEPAVIVEPVDVEPIRFSHVLADNVRSAWKKGQVRVLSLIYVICMKLVYFVSRSFPSRVSVPNVISNELLIYVVSMFAQNCLNPCVVCWLT